ncbi:uncharacterized protein LOC120560142 isoform X2 [Perca fluviatilis]|uniref:uncharacterized protein LOC120560142 isoform X2 n=1 Tax=Perca fluviatilis TaxID=8168 RepID=UPI001965C2E2|nr:uncharacterized protein LOC120560142 isoform X2 [Perca fluviatilis]
MKEGRFLLLLAPLQTALSSLPRTILSLDLLLTCCHLLPCCLLASLLRSQPAIPPSPRLRCLAAHPPSDLRLQVALQWSGRDSSQGSMFALQLQPSRVPTGTQSGFRRRRREPAVLTSADFLRGFLTEQGDWIPPPDPGPADTPKKLRMAFSYRMQRLNASTARRTPTPTRGARRIGSAVNPQ